MFDLRTFDLRTFDLRTFDLWTFLDVFGHFWTFLDILENVKHFSKLLDILGHFRHFQIFSDKNDSSRACMKEFIYSRWLRNLRKVIFPKFHCNKASCYSKKNAIVLKLWENYFPQVSKAP